jgi:hypothetical protein
VPLLLLLSPASLLPVLVRTWGVRALPTQIGDLVFHRLTCLGIATSLIDAVRIGVTADRSVFGIMGESHMNVIEDRLDHQLAG